jgi:hypothetical protein
LCLGSRPGRAGDGWYFDVRGHWAERYIRCLWEEGVADGSQEWILDWQPGWGFSRWLVWNYHPDRAATRAQYTVMLAKAFRLNPIPGSPGFPDVPPGYQAYPGKDAQPLIDAARRRGLVMGYPDGRFLPCRPITRQEAIAILVRGLGLGEYARSLPRAEVERWLGRFGDGHVVESSLRPELAVAVQLRMVLGYPTQPPTLQPHGPLTRAEAAALVYRSCMLVLSADPNPFSPDGDGLDEHTVVGIHTLRNRRIQGWEIGVTDYGGQLLARLGQGSGSPPASLSWTGLDLRGHPMPDGTYYLGGTVVDSLGQVHRAAMHPVVLERKRLWGSLRPPIVKPGQLLRLSAGTSGGASRVVAEPTPSGNLSLSPVEGPASLLSWEGSFTVPADAPDEVREVTLTAIYPRGYRKLTLTYVVHLPTPLIAWVEPAVARAGTTARLWAAAGFPATAVLGNIEGGVRLTLHPAPSPSCHWVATFTVPADWAAGPRVAQVTARMSGRSRTVETTFAVEAARRPDLRFFISD